MFPDKNILWWRIAFKANSNISEYLFVFLMRSNKISRLQYLSDVIMISKLPAGVTTVMHINTCIQQDKHSEDKPQCQYLQTWKHQILLCYKYFFFNSDDITRRVMSRCLTLYLARSTMFSMFLLIFSWLISFNTRRHKNNI